MTRIKYGVMVELLPRHEHRLVKVESYIEEFISRGKAVLHSQIFDTQHEADEYIRTCRHQNLPFRKLWSFSFEYPVEAP